MFLCKMDVIFNINGIECRMKEIILFPKFEYYHNGAKYDVEGEEKGLRFSINKHEVRFVEMDWLAQYEQQIGLISITFGYDYFTPYITALEATSDKIPKIDRNYLLEILLNRNYPKLLPGVETAVIKKIITFGKWHTGTERTVTVMHHEFEFYCNLASEL